MTQFIFHQEYNSFPLSQLFNANKKPCLRINNIKIQQFSSLNNKKPQMLQKQQIHQHQKKKSKNQRSNLISKTIQLISNRKRLSNKSQFDVYNYMDRRNQRYANQEKTRRGFNLSLLDKRKVGGLWRTQQKRGNLSWSLNQEESQRAKQNKHYFQTAFKSVNNRYQNNKNYQDVDTQVLSLSKNSRPSTSQKNYSRFAERNKKIVEQRHKRHLHNLTKSRPNTSNNFQKRMTEMLQPW